MADDSQRAKARATFGSSFFENSKAISPPKNFATAQQKVAQSRPIPTFKVGGPVKKADGGLPGVRQDAVNFRAALNAMPNAPVTGMKPGLTGGMKKGGKVQTSSDTARKLAKEMGGMKKGGAMREGSKKDMAQDIKLAKKAGLSMKDWEKSPMDMKHDMPGMKKVAKKADGGYMDKERSAPLDRAFVKRMAAEANKAKDKDKAMPKTSPADKPSMSRLTPEQKRAMANETAMPGYKMGGKAWEGSAKDEAQDRKLAKKYGMSMKDWEKSKMDMKHDKQQSMEGLKVGGMPGKYAVGGAGKIRKGMAPIKRAQGGAGKVRKGMMTQSGQITPGVKPKKGLGGF